MLLATVKKDLPPYAVKRSAIWTQIWSSLKNWVPEPDSWVFFHIRKWASNPVLRRTFQLQGALENFLYIGNTWYKYLKVSLNVFLYDKKRIEVIGPFKKKWHAKQKNPHPKKKTSLGTTVVCSRISTFDSKLFTSWDEYLELMNSRSDARLVHNHW